MHTMCLACRFRRVGPAGRLLILALVAGAGCAGPERSAGDEVPGAPGPVVEVPSPAQPGSGQPYLTAAADGTVLMSWVEAPEPSQHRLRVAGWSAAGWSAPQTIAQGADWFVNWADVPSIFALSDGRLAAHWLEKSGEETFAYDVRLSVSADGGRSWSRPATPHRDGTQTEHGFVSFFEGTGGALGLVWLDGRDFAGRHAAHDGGMEAEMALRAAWVDRSGAPGDELVLDPRVCDCCPTAAARTPRGAIVAYRDRSEEEVRDISLVRFENGSWTEPYQAHADGWQIPGCPVNGPSLSSDGDSVVLAWFAAPEGAARVSAAFSSDGGASFGPPIAVDEGAPLGRAAAALLPDGTALVAWIESSGQDAAWRVRRVHADGRAGPPVTVAPVTGDRASGHPRMIRRDGEILFAWTDTREGPRVRTAKMALSE